MQIYQVREQLRGGTSIFDLKLRVGYYARVSTEKDEQKLSIDNQQEYFEEYVASHPNWRLVGKYVDDGVSGIHVEKREAFQRMINDSSIGKIDLILTKEISRFARNTLDSIQWTRKLLCYGTCIWFLNDNINTIDADSEFRLTIMAGVAQDEIRKLSSRVSFGHAQSIKKGRVLGSDNMYGYKKKDCKYTIVEDEAKMIREIFELYSTGEWSTKKMEDYLYKKGYRSRKNKKILSRTIGNILINPKYKGYYCGGKVKIIDMFSKKQEFIPEDQWTMYKDEESVPAIVTEELWNKVNALYAERSNTVKNRKTSFKNESNIFTGKIICGEDGQTYWLKCRSIRGKPDKKWRCSNKINNGADACSSFSIDEDELKIMIANIINDLVENFDDVYDEYIKMFMATLNDDCINYEKDVANIKNEIEIANKKKEKLLDCYLMELISKEDFKCKNDVLCDQLIHLQEDLVELQRRVENSNSNNNNDKLRRLKEALEKFSVATYNDINKKVVDEIIEKIVINPIDERKASVEFYLFADDGLTKVYDKNNVKNRAKKMSCSDNTMLKVLPERHIGFTRNLRSCVGHKLKIDYFYSVIL